MEGSFACYESMLPIRRTVLVAKRADTDYDNIQSTNGNNLKVSVEEMELSAQTPFFLRILKKIRKGNAYNHIPLAF